MTSATPREWFPDFYTNPAVMALAKAKRWTISGSIKDEEPDTLKKRKAPIDVRHLIDHRRVRGAWAIDEQCLVDLNELTERIPTAANTAYYIQSATDGLIVIDIEPGCPPEIAQQLLALPNLLYVETSMSGKGYHLIAPMPANFHDFPVAAGKTVLQHKEKWYEILLDHWVTFTRNPVAPEILAAKPTAEPSPDFATLEGFYASLAKEAKATAASSISVQTAIDFPDIPSADAIVAQTLDAATDRLKTLDDFNGDNSRYEFSVLGTLYRQMLYPLIQRMNLGTTYSASDRTWLLYKAAVSVIPERNKHHEKRNGRPFLLDRAAAMIASHDAPDD